MKFRQSLFWDVDVSKLDPDKNPEYVIERILDFGRDEEVRWMWSHYEHSLIKKVAETSRVLHPQTRSLWMLLTATQ
ncbi:MAG: hypothetical protein AAB483_02375 [Patescibacteria group bacterium]